MAAPNDEKRRRNSDEEVIDQEDRGQEPVKDRRPAIDSYTGEPIPEDEIPNIPISEESFADTVENVPLDEDHAMEFLANSRDADDDVVMDQIDDFTSDEDTLDDFAERQDLATGAGALYEALVEHTGHNPDLSGDDIDADWGSVDMNGEESVGGSTPTPDQDVVEELGEAMGITYEDGEELDTYGKLMKRDEKRYEMDPASAEDEEDEEL
jgi:hypothetical protein